MEGTDHHSIYADHRRDWKSNFYVYPVISRRSQGLSIGVNLNPDKACNFDCIYCQVDRSTPGPTRGVDLDILRAELDHMIRIALDETLFSDGKFANAPSELRRLTLPRERQQNLFLSVPTPLVTQQPDVVEPRAPKAELPETRVKRVLHGLPDEKLRMAPVCRDSGYSPVNSR